MNRVVRRVRDIPLVLEYVAVRETSGGVSLRVLVEKNCRAQHTREARVTRATCFLTRAGEIEEISQTRG